MIELERSIEHRWTIDKNVNHQSILTKFAALMADKQNGFTLEDLVDDTITQGRVQEPGAEYYRGSSITTRVRLLQAKYYMFGYDVNDRAKGQKKFMPSPMLRNCIDTADKDIRAQNFLVNLFCIQYPNPANRTPDCFEIYAGRLIIKLLLDFRLEQRLYIDECIWFLPFLEKVTSVIYEDLVESILEYRNFSYEQKLELFESVEDWNYLFANVTHEMNYYFLRLFKDMGVLDLVGDDTHNSGKLFKFLHSEAGDNKTYRNTAYDTRKKISGYVILKKSVLDAARKLTATFSAFDIPTKQTDDDIYNLQDWYTYLYEIEPLSYLACINTTIDRKSEVQAIVDQMVRASKFGSRDGVEFENALKPFMELFDETRDVQIIAGAGNTDLLCTMEERPSERLYKMNVDAKTRNKGLQELNARRLIGHIKKHGAEFCMVVAPRFASGVKQDIDNTKIVAVKSEVLGNYCYLECTRSGKQTADFSSIRQIIDTNLGTDITGKIEELTVSRYAV